MHWNGNTSLLKRRGERREGDGGIVMGHIDLLCMRFSLVSRDVGSEEDKGGGGACSSAQSWAVTQPQSERCCS